MAKKIPLPKDLAATKTGKAARKKAAKASAGEPRPKKVDNGNKKTRSSFDKQSEKLGPARTKASLVASDRAFTRRAIKNKFSQTKLGKEMGVKKPRPYRIYAQRRASRAMISAHGLVAAKKMGAGETG